MEEVRHGECDGGGQLEHIDLSIQLSKSEAPATLTPLCFCIFLPRFLFTSLSLLMQGLSPSLSFLVAIFTKRLVKGLACPQVWIRFTQGLGLCLVLFALREVRRANAREGISFKKKKLQSSAVRAYLSWWGRGIPYRTYPSSFLSL